MFLGERAEEGRRLRYRAILLVGVLALVGIDNAVRDAADVGETVDDVIKPPPFRAVDGGKPMFLEPPPDEAALRRLIPGAPGPGLPMYQIPATVYSSYQRAAESVRRSDPTCNLSWPVLAGIGRVESNHANNGSVAPNGDALPPIYGPELDGTGGKAAIMDGNGNWARAAGPMQFIPSTWARWAADGNRDGKQDAQNAFDASLAAGRYLCYGTADLSTTDGLREAILRYNHSEQYYDTVLKWIKAYERGGGAVPDRPYGSEAAYSSEVDTAAQQGGQLVGATPPPPGAVPPGGQPPSGEQSPSAGQPPPGGGSTPPPGECPGGAEPPPEARPGAPLLCLVDGILNPQSPPLTPILEAVKGVGDQINPAPLPPPPPPPTTPPPPPALPGL